MIHSRRSINLALTGLAGSLIASRAGAQPSSSATPASSLTDSAQIINAVNGIALFADLRDWQRCRQSFTDIVEFDYTSLVGGEPSRIAADQQMQQWAEFFSSTFKTTQHILGSHVVTITGDQATCLSNFQAHHSYLDPQKGSWVLAGFYQHGLVRTDGWKVSTMKMTWTWEDGTRPF